jgi:tRNA threonylcarbamoyladenosine biosynthesis protein TsaB
MKMYLDTSTPTVVLRLDQDEFKWQADREMAKGILKFISDKLQEKDTKWQDIESITFYSGPGSFTGLRIGASVVNALAHELRIPLFDHNGNKKEIIIPNYGRPANTTPPKK